MRRIHELIASNSPDVTAVIGHDGRAFTYAELHDATRELTEQLRLHGIRQGDRVVVVAENCVAFVSTMLALSHLDAVTIPVNARLTGSEIQRIADHADARCLLLTSDASDIARDHAAAFGAVTLEKLSAGSLAITPLRSVSPEHIPRDASHTAVLMYTSGTTGAPKGVMLSHGNLLFSVPVGARLRALIPEDIVLGLLPCTHIFGLTSVVLAPLSVGARLILMQRFDVEVTLDHLRDGVTVLPAVPQIYIALLNRLRESSDTFRHALRFAYAGGAPMLPSVKKAVEETLGVPLHNGYGLTEAAPSVAATRAGAPRDDGSVGPALDGVEVHVERPNADGIGEILVRGPNVTKGYFRQPEATQAATTKEGFLRTGDLGRMGRDGELYLVGRLKELIIHSGFNVYPPEVETALTSHPAVELAAVVGRASNGNEDVIAFITLNTPLTEDNLRSWCRERLAAYKVPARIFVLESMPQAATGKILKHQLLADLGDSFEDQGTLENCADE
ncbi:MAG: class I adenylate-forming enzyme family protein [Paracoccaceae bacterium]